MTSPDLEKHMALAAFRDTLASIFQSGDLGHYSESFSRFLTQRDMEFVVSTDQLLKTDTASVKGKLRPKVSTDNSDETNPVPDGKGRFYFTRSGPYTLLGSEDVFISSIDSEDSYITRLPRPINDAHENSMLFVDGDTLYVYGQYDSRNRYFVTMGFPPKTIPTMIMNHPNGFPKYSNYMYVYDPFADFPSLDLSLFFPISRMMNEMESKLVEMSNIASGSADSRGGVFLFILDNENNYEYCKQLSSPINTPYWDSDLYYSKEKAVAFVSSDRTSNASVIGDKQSAGKSNMYLTAGNTDLFLIDQAWIGTDTQYVFDYPINTELSERSPSLSFSEDTLFFASNGLPGFGGFDIYYCVKVFKGSFRYWTKPRNLGPLVNSIGDELWFRQYDNGRYVYSSNKGGTFDIYNAVTADCFVRLHARQTCGDFLEYNAYFKREPGGIETIHISYEASPEATEVKVSYLQGKILIDRAFNVACVERNGLADYEMFHKACELKQATSLNRQPTDVYISECESDGSVSNLASALASILKSDSEILVKIEFPSSRRFTANLIADVLRINNIRYELVESENEHLLIKY